MHFLESRAWNVVGLTGNLGQATWFLLCLLSLLFCTALSLFFTSVCFCHLETPHFRCLGPSTKFWRERT